MTPNLELQWHTLINRLIDLDCTWDTNNEIQSIIVPFSPEARNSLYEWQNNHAKLCDYENNEVLLGVYCKIEIYVIRFCLIIQITRWLCGECSKEMIDIESVRRAIQLAEYFKNNAIKVQNLMNETILSTQQQSLLSHLPEYFTTAQGIQIASEEGMKERAFKDFLSKHIGTLFLKESHGEYRKI